jgi:hypothetical protein
MSDEPDTWGVSHSVALMLAALDLDVVHRSTLRALLPAGRTRFLGTSASYVRHVERGHGSSVNVISKKFQRALWIFEDAGWIVRGEEYVLIRNRRGLLDWAVKAEPPDWVRFPLEDAVRQVNRDLAAAQRLSPRAVEQRRRELLALKRLIDEDFGAGKGRVRLLPRSKPL